MKPPHHKDVSQPQPHREFRCPTCKRIVRLSEQDSARHMTFFPFCSERCKLIDLGAWLDAEYRIPKQSEEESELLPGENSSPPQALSQ
jgi:endogenous inhibitor of DNA gyrase (YacG/DUF329 family)